MVVDSPLKSVCLLIGLTPCPSHPLSLHQYFPFSPFFCSFSINSIPFSSYLLTHLSTIIRPTNIWYLSHLFHPHNSTLYPVLHVMKIPDVIQGLRPHPIPQCVSIGIYIYPSHPLKELYEKKVRMKLSRQEKWRRSSSNKEMRNNAPQMLPCHTEK